MSVRMDVSGPDGFATSLAAAADQLRNLEHANAAAGRLVAAAADQKVPRRTGRLASSQRVAVSGEDVTVSYTAPYAGVLDSGAPSRGIRGTRYLTGALEDSYSALDALYGREVQHIVATIHD